MGVSGSGKTTIGRLLAERTGWTFHDADDYHGVDGIAKMRAGIPLTDEDRIPWLETLRRDVVAPSLADRRAGDPCLLGAEGGVPRAPGRRRSAGASDLPEGRLTG